MKRINRRWIVHGGLRESAAAYIMELEESDPARLRSSCGLAMELVHSAASGGDPKPWFYAGLFAMATPGEAARHLRDHPLTRAAWERVNGVATPRDVPESVRMLAARLVREIRKSMVPAP